MPETTPTIVAEKERDGDTAKLNWRMPLQSKSCNCGDHGSQNDADHPSGETQDDRFQKKLRQDDGSICPNSSSHSYLTRSFRYSDEHDIHDEDPPTASETWASDVSMRLTMPETEFEVCISSV
jgi:hypothetical protein